MSDHYPCFVSYQLLDNKKMSDKITDKVIAKFQQALLFHDWSDIEFLPVDEGYNYFNLVITKYLDQFPPKKTITVRSDDRFVEAWLTVKLCKYNAKSRKLCNKARQTGLPEDHVK